MNFPDVGGGRSGSGGIDSSLFIKMKNGDKLNGVFRGEPKIFRVHWVNGRSSLCSGQATCQLCEGARVDEKLKAKFRFQLNFITKVDGVWMAKVFEGSYQTYKELKELHESDYNLEETAVSIKRDGEKTDTRYVVMPLKNNGGLKPADFKAVAALPLNQLKEDAPDAEAPAAGDANEDVPF